LFDTISPCHELLRQRPVQAGSREQLKENGLREPEVKQLSKAYALVRTKDSTPPMAFKKSRPR
jgi:hypothetical protein